MTTTLEAMHETCGAHFAYKLTCSEADALLAQAAGRCQRCGQPSRRLLYDHDHAVAWHAVRGLVCDSCNQHLARVDNGDRDPDDLDIAYLNDPWHARHRPGLAARLTHRRSRRKVMKSFRLPPATNEEFERCCEAEQVNQSDVLRELVEAWVKERA